jgi:cytochrome c-type biogenesis protein CcmH
MWLVKLGLRRPYTFAVVAILLAVLGGLNHPCRSRRRFHVVRALIVLVLALALPGSVSGTDLEREARELEAILIAPCCFPQQVSIHHSPAADQVRRDIRQRLAAGQMRDEILKAYVAQYGKRILVEPPAEGVDWLLYVLPPFGFVASAGLTVSLVRRFTMRGKSPAVLAGASAAGTETESDAEHQYGARLDEQLQDLD